jgi:hypothetical protein
MIFASKTSLGIEISSRRVSFALLGEVKGKLRVLKADSVDLAEGMISSGSIVDPLAFGKCLRKLLKGNGVNQSKAFISLTANSSLMQIVEMPLDIPENIGQFVKSEVRHSAILSGQDYSFDYCGFGNDGAKGNDRVIVSAVDTQKLSGLLKSLSIAGIEPVAVSPANLGWIRALYSQYVMVNYDANMLFAISDDISMTICVFSKGKLDFVRTVEIPIGLDADEYMGNFAKELNAVRQYYDIEVSPLEDEKWNVVVEIDSEVASFEHVRDFFANTGDDVCVCSADNAVDHISVGAGKSVKAVSISAVGLAMGEYGKDGMNIALDLVPKSFREVKKAKLVVFAAACIVAIVLISLLVSNGLMGPRFAQAEKTVITTKENLDLTAVPKLTIQKAAIEEQISNLEQRRDYMLAVSDQNRSNDWSKILAVIVEKSSSDICITSLKQVDDHAIEIVGKVPQYKAAYVLAGLLSRSELFESAEVSDVNRDDQFEGLINYSINCALVSDGSIEPDGK